MRYAISSDLIMLNMHLIPVLTRPGITIRHSFMCMYLHPKCYQRHLSLPMHVCGHVCPCSQTHRSYDHPGMSWRVGVRAMVDSSALSTLGPLGAAMMDKRTVPAVMVVDAYMAPPQMDGAKLMLPSGMHIKVEVRTIQIQIQISAHFECEVFL